MSIVSGKVEANRINIKGRKLRHLNGIALRNITEKIPVRPRGRSNDDESIVASWRSPAKILSVQEASSLPQSRSSNDLVSLSLASQSLNASSSADDRPMRGKVRRRSTRLSLDDTPSRSKQSEKVEISRLPDTFFSLHQESGGGLPRSFYTASFLTVRVRRKADIHKRSRTELHGMELLEGPVRIRLIKVQNPNFQPFDLGECGPSVTWLDNVTIRVWTRTRENFKLLLEAEIALQLLQYLGTQVWQYY